MKVSLVYAYSNMVKSYYKTTRGLIYDIGICKIVIFHGNLSNSMNSVLIMSKTKTKINQLDPYSNLPLAV